MSAGLFNRTFRYNTVNVIFRRGLHMQLTNKPTNINLAPLLPNVISDVNYNPWVRETKIPIGLPMLNELSKELPSVNTWNILTEFPVVVPIECPTSDEYKPAKHAARLIVIRRKKMKKHKLKKLRKRMKFYRAKIRQRREMKKEKEFQAVLIAQCKEGEAFSAENYVLERLNKLKKLKEALSAESIAK